jgi:hypothetical protein
MADRFEAKMNLVFGVGVSEEFTGLYRAGVFTAAELDRIRRWSLEVTPPPEPAAA